MTFFARYPLPCPVTPEMLKEWRKEYHQTQESLGFLLLTSQSRVAKWESGDSLPPRHIWLTLRGASAYLEGREA